MNISFRPFTEADIEPAAPIMERAFNEDALMHRGKACGPEGYDDGSFLRKYALNPASDAYCILGDGELIGVAILWIDREKHESYLGCLFTEPALHSRGLGTAIWREIEKMYPDTRVWHTETPLCSTRNLNFYINKCGFAAHKISDPKDREEALVALIKYMRVKDVSH